MSDRLLNARELAERWGVSVATILDRYEAGDLPGLSIFGKKGGPVRFRLSDVEALERAWLRKRPAA